MKTGKIKILLVVLVSLSIGREIRCQTVTTQFGQIKGSMNGSVYQFLGIPYAKPPVGNLRWKAPENPAAWSGTLATTDFAPVCPQKNFEQGGTSSTITGDEDCLYLNVWSPNVKARLPVMVYIHGGGNQQGSASEENGGTVMFFGKNLSERGNVVVVTIQYRLGPLGFLVHPGLEQENANGKSGNYAILDQILALQWVKNNIAAFGGDPQKVTIFGESAGGVNVGNLLTTPLATGLFHRAIIQSAVPVLGSYSAAKTKGMSFVDTFTTVGNATEKISNMRSLPADSLVKYETPPLKGGAVGMNWQSVIDEKVFFDTPISVVQSGHFNNVPLIIGTNADEMSLSAPETVYPLMVTALRNSLVPDSLQTRAAALYPSGSTTAEARNAYVGILTDAQFTAPARRLAQCVSLNQTEPVYRYFFSYRHSLTALADLGSYHGMELFYVFNNWENATLGRGPLFKPSDDAVQKAMLGYWVNFAYTGDPNGSGLAVWPRSQAGNDCYLEISENPNGSQCGLRTAQSDLWDDAMGFSGCIKTVTNDNTLTGNDILLYPNPTTGIVKIDIPGNSRYVVNIYDAFGQKVGSLKNPHQLDLTPLKRGLYLIEVVTDKKTWYRKIMRQ